MLLFIIMGAHFSKRKRLFTQRRCPKTANEILRRRIMFDLKRMHNCLNELKEEVHIIKNEISTNQKNNYTS
jgi:hypothetical protein